MRASKSVSWKTYIKKSSTRNTVSRPFPGQWQHMAGSSEHPSACRVILGGLLFQPQEFFHHQLAMSISSSSFAVGTLTLGNHAATLQNENGTISNPRGMLTWKCLCFIQNTLSSAFESFSSKKHLKFSVMVTCKLFCNPDGYHPSISSI